MRTNNQCKQVIIYYHINNQQLINLMFDTYNIHHQLQQQRQSPVIAVSNSFYYNLEHYQPMCHYRSKQISSPLSQQQHQQQQQQEEYQKFLMNNGWWKSFLCIVLMDILFILTYFKFVLDSRTSYKSTNSNNNNPSSQNVQQYYTHSPNFKIMELLMIITISFINLSYIFTQFLNPGIRNLSLITQQQLNEAENMTYCDKCQQYKTQKFTHCSQCQICIWNYDHHCGFFSKCIGGQAQIIAFYLFLFSVTIAFLTLLACMCIQMGQV